MCNIQGINICVIYKASICIANGKTISHYRAVTRQILKLVIATISKALKFCPKKHRRELSKLVRRFKNEDYIVHHQIVHQIVIKFAIFYFFMFLHFTFILQNPMMSLLTKQLVGECLILINFGANFNLW